MTQGADLPDPRALLRAIGAELQSHGDARSLLAVAAGTLSVSGEDTGWSAEGGLRLELHLPAGLLGAVLASPRIQDELGQGAARAVAAAGPRSYLGLTFGYARPGVEAAYRGSSPAAGSDPEGALREAQALLGGSPAHAPLPSLPRCEPPPCVWIDNGVLCTKSVPVALLPWVQRIAAAHAVTTR